MSDLPKAAIPSKAAAIALSSNLNKTVILSEVEGPALVLSPQPSKPRAHPRRSKIAATLGTYLLTTLLLFPATHLHAQREGPALTESEIEQLRDSAYIATDRILVFVKLLDERTRTIQATSVGPRKPGREQDLHDLMEQFTSIADELDDNLDEYGPAHRDMRKALPKLLAATERWATILKTPPDNEAYNVSRKLSLEAIRDIREETTKLIDDQRTWFINHPPPKESKGEASYPLPH